MRQIESLEISPEMLNLIVWIDEFKGAGRALSTLAPKRLRTLRRVAAIESIGFFTRIEGSKLLDREVEKLLYNLQQLKDEVHSGTARELLLRTSKPIKQVAAPAGFRNEMSFIRAFREWTGVSPVEFRRGMQA